VVVRLESKCESYFFIRVEWFRWNREGAPEVGKEGTKVVQVYLRELGKERTRCWEAKLEADTE